MKMASSNIAAASFQATVMVRRLVDFLIAADGGDYLRITSRRSISQCVVSTTSASRRADGMPTETLTNFGVRYGEQPDAGSRALAPLSLAAAAAAGHRRQGLRHAGEHQGLEDDGIKAYMPLPNWSRRLGFHGQEQFTHLAERDVYVCPQGQELARRTSSQRSSAHFYRAAAGVRQACPALSACTSSPQGRTIRRPFDQEYIERVRRYHDTEPCLRVIRKRQAWVEPLFAEAKIRHGLRRWRRSHRVWRT